MSDREGNDFIEIIRRAFQRDNDVTEPPQAEAQIARATDPEMGRPVTVTFFGDDGRPVTTFKDAREFVVSGGACPQLWVKLEEGRLMRLSHNHDHPGPFDEIPF